MKVVHVKYTDKEAFATRLLDVFGDKLLDVIDRGPDASLEVLLADDVEWDYVDKVAAARNEFNPTQVLTRTDILHQRISALEQRVAALEGGQSYAITSTASEPDSMPIPSPAAASSTPTKSGPNSI